MVKDDCAERTSKKDENVENLAMHSMSMAFGLLIVTAILFATSGICGKFALVGWFGGLCLVFTLFDLAMSYEEYKNG